MNTNLTISIVIHTYNGERFLRKQLDSLVSQYRLPDEVIISDDGSTDHTYKILEKWISEVPFPVRIKKNETQHGRDQNLEETTPCCLGDVVFFCEQDGIWSPNKIEKMMTILETCPEIGAVYCDGQIVEQDGKPSRFLLSQIMYSEIICDGLGIIAPQPLKTPNPTVSCMAVRSSLLTKEFPVFSEIRYDWRLFLKVSALSNVVTLHDILQDCRITETVTYGENLLDRWVEQKINEYLQSEWTVEAYQNLAKGLVQFRKWLETLPETPQIRKSIRYLKGTQRHYTNREKIRRNFFLHAFQWFEELFSGRYGQRDRSFECLISDLVAGTKSAMYMSRPDTKTEEETV